MSSNGSLFLFLFNLKGHRVFLQVQRSHLPKPARGQGADCQAKLCRVRVSWMDPSHLHQHTSEVEI